MSDYITPQARKLLQRLTARASTLSYDREQETWHLGNERLTGKREAAARELLYLCAIQTAIRLHPMIVFELAPEGTRILMRPNYIPVILAAQNRKQTTAP